MKTLSCLLIFGLAFCSCGGIKDPEFKDIENLKLGRLGLNNSTLKMDLVYINPNKFGMKLSRAEGEAWIDDNLLGHFTVDTLIQIAPLTDFRLPVKLQVEMSKILTNSMIAILAPEVTLKFEGNARIGKGFVFINYPIRYEGKHKLSELIQ